MLQHLKVGVTGLKLLSLHHKSGPASNLPVIISWSIIYLVVGVVDTDYLPSDNL